MVTQVIRNQYNEIQIGNFCQFGVRKKTNTGGGEIPSNEMYFTTTSGALSYLGNSGDVITFSDGTTYTVLEDGGFSSENVPTGKHKVKLVTERSESYGVIGIDGEALIELHNFPSLESVVYFNFSPNTSSPNLVKVPMVLPSNIISLSQMFYEATNFNQDISGWDTSNITEMIQVFKDASAFNQPVSSWNTAKVTDMGWMFNGANSFNQPIDNWDVSSVTNMGGMFSGASLFNQDLSQWCVPLVTSSPSDFADGSALLEGNFPIWGTCPA